MRSVKHIIAIRITYVIFDICLITLAFYLACLLRPQTLPFSISWSEFFVNNTNPYRLVFLVWMFIIIYFNQMHGLYRTKREIIETIEVVEVVKSVVISSLIFIVLLYLWKMTHFPRSVVLISAVLIIFFLSLWRIGKKLLVEYLVSNGYNNFNVLIIGAGKVGHALAKEIRRRKGLGLRIVGFLDDHKITIEGGLPVLGKINDLLPVLKKEFIHEIFITVHHDSQVFMNILEQAKAHKVAVRVIPQGYEMMASDIIRYNIGIIPVLAYSDVEINYRQRAKRLFDLAVALVALFLLSPVFLLIAILIKKEDGGCIFYRSKRYGQDGKTFEMLKFRSMVLNADQLLSTLKCKNEADGPIFKIKEDPRITKIGKILRKYSLDELPQLINVVKGEMSLVGPRPLPIDQVEKEDFRQLKRLNTRPGITGLWQIRGRSDVSFDRLVRWDIWYINNWSFTLDLYILMQTIPVVLKAKGAY